MENYKFVFNGKNYELNEDNCNDFMNDEEYPVAGIKEYSVLDLLSSNDKVNFDIGYYDQPCPSCQAGQASKDEKANHFKFLEYQFYIFTKKGEYVISSISKEYENVSFAQLLREGKADNSYIVSVIVCVDCGEYSIEIEQCEV